MGVAELDEHKPDCNRQRGSALCCVSPETKKRTPASGERRQRAECEVYMV